MKHRFAYLMAACLALAAGPHTVMSASPAGQPLGNVDILVDGAPQPRYPHDGRWVRRGAQRAGSSTFGFVTPTPSVWPWLCRSMGSTPSMRAKRPRQTRASGCSARTKPSPSAGGRPSQTEARRFEFTTEARSYGQALGKTTNLGVISAAVLQGAPARHHGGQVQQQNAQPGGAGRTVVVGFGRAGHSGGRGREHGGA